MRGFNFIEDYATLLGKTENITHADILNALAEMAVYEKKYKDAFTNCEYEKKRFIAWFYQSHKYDFELILAKDLSGFLASCISLYDPRTGSVKPPVNSADMRPNFS